MKETLGGWHWPQGEEAGADDGADPGLANAPTPASDASTDRDAEGEDDDGQEVTFSYYPWWTDGEPEVEYADPGNVPDPGHDDDSPDPAQDAGSGSGSQSESSAARSESYDAAALKCRSCPTLTPMRCSASATDLRGRQGRSRTGCRSPTPRRTRGRGRRPAIGPSRAGRCCRDLRHLPLKAV